MPPVKNMLGATSLIHFICIKAENLLKIMTKLEDALKHNYKIINFKRNGKVRKLSSSGDEHKFNQD